MTFPATPRVVYERNPLEEVICQLRFPPILKIDADSPADFQERIRDQYPELAVVSNAIADVPLPPGIPDSVASQIKGMFPSTPPSYQFKSDDGRVSISLNRESIAISDTRYTTWQDFLAYFELPLAALQDIYRPNWFSRVGLRYRNVICRAELGLEDRAWSQLLKPFIAGALVEQAVARGARQIASNILADIDGGAHVRLRHGLGQRQQTNEQCYLIDADFYKEERSTSDEARELLNHFNREAGHLFRWAIADLLHEGLGPRAI